LRRYPTLPSTNGEALRLATAGAPDRTAVLAERQTQGRGRRGRGWAFLPGNLALSLIIDRGAAAAAPGLLSLAVGVAAAQACRAFGIDARLKWPNDVMLDAAKLGGILIEAATPHRYIAGIGLNLAAAPAIEGRATVSLAERLGRDAAPSLDAFLAVFEPVLTGWADRWAAGDGASIRAAWLAQADRLGQTITLTDGDATVAGIFRSIAEDGALGLESDGGLRFFHAGEILS
jgi:BirA family biotin operon repressor/biotin-[acetyl-CoA-carboxylase] ligase